MRSIWLLWSGALAIVEGISGSGNLGAAALLPPCIRGRQECRPSYSTQDVQMKPAVNGRAVLFVQLFRILHFVLEALAQRLRQRLFDGRRFRARAEDDAAAGHSSAFDFRPQFMNLPRLHPIL